MRGKRWLIAVAVVAVALGAAACDEPAGLPDLVVHTMEVDPATAELAVGDTVRLTAYPRLQDGVIHGSVGVEWTIDAPHRVAVVEQGYSLRVTALETGPVVITATSDGKSADATLTIVAGAVATHTFTARAWDARSATRRRPR